MFHHVVEFTSAEENNGNFLSEYKKPLYSCKKNLKVYHITLAQDHKISSYSNSKLFTVKNLKKKIVDVKLEIPIYH